MSAETRTALPQWRSGAVAQWKAATPEQQTKWATAYTDAIGTAAADGEPATRASGEVAKVASGDYGPVPALSAALLGLAKAGGLEGALTSSGNFYGSDQTNQGGMMNEVGNAPGQPPPTRGGLCQLRTV